MLAGIKYKMMLGYKEGKVSLGTLAKRLGVSLSEALDLLASLGIPAPVGYDDYLQGLETARRLFARRSARFTGLRTTSGKLKADS